MRFCGHKLNSLLSWCCGLLLCLPVVLAQSEFHVDPVNGNDSTGTGALAKPWKSLSKANAKVKELHNTMSSDITVYLRGGDYVSSTTVLSLTSDQSGKNGYQVIYRNYPGERPVLRCGTRLTGWTLHSVNIYKATTTLSNITTLIENESSAFKARFPNRAANGARQYKTAVAASPIAKNKFSYTAGDLPAIANPATLECFMWSGGDHGDIAWFSDTIAVSSLDTATRTISLAASTKYNIGTGSRYYLQNALELLDEPGEFFLDDANNTIYYWPYNVDIATQAIYATGNANTITVSGTDIILDGLTVIGSGYSGGLSPKSGILVTNSVSEARAIVRNCEVMHAGNHGISFNNFAAGCVAENNYIHDTGEAGIDLGRTNNYCRDHLVTNNRILRVGQLVGHGPGINIWDCGGHTIRHNRIENAGRFGIGGRTGTTNPNTTAISGVTIENNEIVDCMNDSQDGGSIYFFYAGGDAAKPVILRNNVIRDANLTFGGAPLGIYLDDTCRDFIIENNLVHNLQKASPSFEISGNMFKGDRHFIRNNYVVDNHVATTTAPMQFMYLGTEITTASRTNRDNVLERNILAYNNTPFVFDFTSTWTNDKLKSSENNLIYNPAGLYTLKTCPLASNWSQWPVILSRKYDQRSLTAEPGFVNRAARDYRLRYDSPGNRLGIRDLDISGTGLTAAFPFANASDPLSQAFVKAAGATADAATVDVPIGGTTTLALSARTTQGFVVTPGQPGVSVAFTSAQPSIATVSPDGTVTGQSKGMATITASITRGGITRSAVLFISVGDRMATLAIESVTNSVIAGGKLPLYAVATTDNGRLADLTASTTFESSNPSVASVDAAGVVTGNANGTATITATTVFNGQSLTQTKQIAVGTVVLSSVTLTAGNPDLKVGQTTQLTATGKMSDGSNANLSGATINYLPSPYVTVSSGGLVTATSEGYGYVSAEVILNGFTAVGSVIIKVYGNTVPPSPWMVKNYGSAAGAASRNATTGDIWILSNGTDAWTSPDSDTEVLQSLSSANTLFATATVGTYYQTNANAQSGIMIRESDSNTARFVNLRIRPDGGIRFVWRATAGSNATYAGNAFSTPLPATLKLTRDGDTFSAFYRDWYGDWIPCGTCTVSMGSTVLAGLSASANSGLTEKTLVGFSDIFLSTSEFDETPPQWTSGWPKADTILSTGFTARASIDEPGTAYYVVVASGSTAPSAAQVKAGQNAAGTAALQSGSLTLTTATEAFAAVSGLSPGTSYDVWFVAEDAAFSPNLQSAPTLAGITTAPPAAAQSITFATLAGSTYGAAPINLNATATSGLPVAFTVVSGPATVSGSVLTLTGAGSITVRASQSGNAAFEPASPVEQTFTSSPAALTVTADDQSRTVGAANPDWTVSYTGFVNGDTFADLSGTLTFSGPATETIPASPVGDYAITPGGLSSNNYLITYAAGTLSIIPDTAAPIWISGWPKADTLSSTGFTVRARINEAGTAYYVVLPGGSPAPSIARILAGQNADGNAALRAGSISLAADAEGSAAITGLSAETAYDLHLVAADSSANQQAASTPLTVTTRGSEVSWLGTSSNAWTNAANWQDGKAPANELSGNIARFNLASYPNQPNAGTTAIRGLVVGGSSAAFTLSTTNLSLGDAGLTVASGAGSPSLNSTSGGTITLGASQTWTNNSANAVLVNRTVAFGTNQLTLDGSGNFTLQNSASWTGSAGSALTLASTYTGTVTHAGSSSVAALNVNGGTYIMSANTAFGSGTIALGGTGNATIQNNLASTSQGNALVVAAGSTGTKRILGGLTNTGGFGTGNKTIDAAVTFDTVSANSTLPLSGSGKWAGAGTVTIGGAGNGTVTLGGGVQSGQTFTSAFELVGGILKVNNDANGRPFSAANAIAIGSAAAFDINGADTTVAGLTDRNGGGGSVVNTGSSDKTLTLGGSGSYAFSGGISPATASRVKLATTGSGSHRLSGTSSYTGTTSVGGTSTLLVDGSLAATAVTVANGATLGGNGSLGGNVTISAGGKLAFSLLGPAASHDRMDIAGTLAFSGASTLTITHDGGTPATGDYLLVRAATITGSAPATLILPNGWAGSVAKAPNGTDLVLSITGVPAATSGSFASWIASQSGVGTQTGATEDPDADGVPNLVEYALGGSPGDAANAPRPQVVISNSTLQLTFTPQRVAGLRYVIEASPDLSDWSNQTDITSQLTPGTPHTHIDTTSVTTSRFLRLRVRE